MMSVHLSALKLIVSNETRNKNATKLVILGENNEQEVTIGRDTECTIRIASIEISRRHAKLTRDDNNLWNILDLKSTNGLFVNEEQLNPYSLRLLKNGDTIAFGPPDKSEFKYVFVAKWNSLLSADNQVDNRSEIQVSGFSIPCSIPRVLVNPNNHITVGNSSNLASNIYFRFNSSGNASVSLTMPTRSGTNYSAPTSREGVRKSSNRSTSRNRRENYSVVVISDEEDDENPKVENHNRRSSVRDVKKYEEALKKAAEKYEQVKREKRDLQVKEERAKKKLKQTEERMKQKEKETLEKEKELAKLKEMIKNNTDEVKLSGKRKHATSKQESQKRTCPETDKTDIEEIFDTELQCTICHELFVSPVNLNCSHAFCLICIEKWKTGGHSDCPICREAITSQTRLLVLDNLIERAAAKMKHSQKEYRNKLVEERKIEEEKLKKPKASAPRFKEYLRGFTAVSQFFVRTTSHDSDSEDASSWTSDDSDDVNVIGIHVGGNHSDSASSASSSSSSDSDSDSDISSISSANSTVDRRSDPASIPSSDDSESDSDSDSVESGRSAESPNREELFSEDENSESDFDDSEVSISSADNSDF